MKIKVAMFGWTRWPDWKPTPRAEHEDNENTDYTRISEWIDVEFPELPKEEVVQMKVGMLRKEREEIVAEFTKKLSLIDEHLAELQALPAPAIQAAPSASPEPEESPA